MISGAILKQLSGVDLDAALSQGAMDRYLEAAAAQTPILVGNLSLWIVGVLFFGVAAAALARCCRRRPAWGQVAQFCYWTAVPLAIGAFVAWLALVVQLAPGATGEQVAAAEALGWWASRADWIATDLVVGIGPLVFSLAGRGDWNPSWLAWLALAAGAAAAMNVLAMFTDALTSYGFLIVPVGLAWSLAAGVHLVRQRGSNLEGASG